MQDWASIFKKFLLALVAGAALNACATREPSPVAAPGGAGDDRALAAAIRQRLEMDPMLRGQVYGIDVANGEVTVQGVVRNEAERLRILSIVRGTPGVTQVQDRLRLFR